MNRNKVLETVLLGGSIYLLTGILSIDYACKRKERNEKDPNKGNIWLKHQVFENYEIQSIDGLCLKGKFLRAKDPNSQKLLLAVHGYQSYNLREYGDYLEFYHNLGFHILMPDNRAHGESEGKYIGFGWQDRIDIKEWIKKAKKILNNDIEIVLQGISMGSSTVLMLSGDKDLDKSVKCIIADCGYTSANEEFKYTLKKKKMPYHIMLSSANLISKKKVGYKFKDASAINQVKKSNTPILFIHGDQDTFVPTYMVYQLYDNCQAPKDLLIVEGAKHAESYQTNKQLYESKIVEFITEYLDN